MTLQMALVILHLLMIAMGIGLSLSNFINTKLALKNGGEFSKGLALQRRTIGRMGDGVIALIWVTGIILLTQRAGQGLPPAFHVKLLFVIGLTLFHALARRDGETMRKNQNAGLLPRQSNFILAVWLCAVAALICAVIAFGG
jgi:uncharacterized membrane protein